MARGVIYGSFCIYASIARCRSLRCSPPNSNWHVGNSSSGLLSQSNVSTKLFGHFLNRLLGHTQNQPQGQADSPFPSLLRALRSAQGQRENSRRQRLVKSINCSFLTQSLCTCRRLALRPWEKTHVPVSRILNVILPADGILRDILQLTPLRSLGV